MHFLSLTQTRQLSKQVRRKAAEVYVSVFNENEQLPLQVQCSFQKGNGPQREAQNMTYMYLYTASFSLCCNTSFAQVLPVVCSFSRRLMVADLSSSALVYVFQDCKSSSNGSTCSMVCSRHQLQRKKNGGTGVNVMYSFQHLN